MKARENQLPPEFAKTLSQSSPVVEVTLPSSSNGLAGETALEPGTKMTSTARASPTSAIESRTCCLMLDRADSNLAFTDPSLDVCLTNASGGPARLGASTDMPGRSKPLLLVVRAVRPSSDCRRARQT